MYRLYNLYSTPPIENVTNPAKIVITCFWIHFKGEFRNFGITVPLLMAPLHPIIPSHGISIVIP